MIQLGFDIMSAIQWNLSKGDIGTWKFSSLERLSFMERSNNTLKLFNDIPLHVVPFIRGFTLLPRVVS